MPSELHGSTPPMPGDIRPLEGLARTEPQLALARQLYGTDESDETILMRWGDDGSAKAFSDLLKEDAAFHRAVYQYEEHSTPENFAVIERMLRERRLQ